MNIYRNVAFFAILGFLLAACLVVSPAMRAADRPALDSDEITKLLAEAKTEAFDLKNDAEKLESFTRSKISWEHHATVIEQMKEHVNEVGRLVAKMNDARIAGSPWQQQAIEQVTPVLKELATNTTAAIEHLNENKGRLHTPEYKELLTVNYDLATELSALVTDFVDYGKTKAKYERLTNKLEVEHR